MSRRGESLVAGVCLLAVIAAVAWYAFSGGGAEPPVGSAGSEDAKAAAAPRSAAVSDPVLDEARPSAQRTAVDDDAPADQGAPPADGLAVFRGRAVDEAGQPLAGVTAVVHGWGRISQTMDAYRAEYGEVEWTDPEPVVTGADGRFEITFAPPPPFQYALDLELPGRVTADGRWGRIEPGTIKDFGDVTLGTGARVTGRFVDAAGQPVAPPVDRRVRLSIDRYNRRDQPRGEMTPTQSVRATIRPDGRFAFADPVDPGMWNVSLRGLLLHDPPQEVEITAPDTALEVVVVRPETLLRVSGLVVDEVGEPVSRARLEPVGTTRASTWLLSTGRDGAFEMVQRPDTVDPEQGFGIAVEKKGHRRTTAEGIHWGDDDLRLVLPRIPAMEVLVLRAADRTPVEEYGLRVMNTAGRRSSTEFECIDGWQHPEGITRITTMQRGGAKHVFVEPRVGAGLAPVLQRVEVDVAAPPQLTIELPEAVEQPLRVVHADGRPAAGTRIELVDNMGEPVAVQARVLAFGSGAWSTAFHGIRIAAAETDADGRCTVAGPPEVPLTIRAFGDHPSLVEDGVRLDGQERRLELTPGATLTVRIDPPEVVAAWRRAAGLPERGGVDERQEFDLPRVSLRSSAAGSRETFPPGGTRRGVAFDDSGVAVLRGAPVGTWQVECRWSDGGRYEDMVASRPVRIEAGVNQEFVVDASAYRVGSVSGRLMVDGEPAADANLTLRRTLDAANPDGSPRTERLSAVVGSDGTFTRELPVGAWRAFARVPRAKTGAHPDRWVTLRALPDLVVAAGTEHTAELRASSARAELRVVGPDGEPVAGLRLWCPRRDWFESPAIAVSDSEGRSTMVGNPGTYRLRCRIRSLRSDETYRKALDAAVEAHGGDREAARAALDATVDVPSPLTIPAPDGAGVVEIRLPESWDR